MFSANSQQPIANSQQPIANTNRKDSDKFCVTKETTSFFIYKQLASRTNLRGVCSIYAITKQQPIRIAQQFCRVLFCVCVIGILLDVNRGVFVLWHLCLRWLNRSSSETAPMGFARCSDRLREARRQVTRDEKAGFARCVEECLQIKYEGSTYPV